jgi:membrane protease YdiL (CAAX protease family)
MKNQKYVLLFFVFTFIWTWVFYCAIVFFRLSPYEGPGMVLLICGGCSPTFVGLIMALVTYNKTDKLDYIKSCYQVKRIGARRWIFIILIFPVIHTVSIFFDLLTGGTLPEMTNLRAVLQNPVSFIPLLLLSFMSGPFSEELGWRGFALKPLLDRFGFTRASVLLGLIWGVWHLPLYFMPETWHGQMGFALAGFWMFLLLNIGLSAIMSFVFIKTNHSIVSAMLLHLTNNFTAQLLAKTSDTVEIVNSLLIFGVGIVLCIYMGILTPEK